MANQWKVKSTTESLLRGVPGDDYLIAFGQTVHPTQMKEAMKGIDPLLTALKDEAGADAEQVEQLKSAMDDWVPLFAGMRGSIVATSPGSDGLFAANLIVDTSSSKKWLKGFGEIFNVVKNFSVDSEDFKEVMGYFSHNAEAEEISGVTIEHLKLDIFEIAKNEEVEEDVVEAITKIIGKEGLVFRMGAIDNKTVVIGLGGQSRMAQFIELAKSEGAPLDSDSGIKKVNAYLPKDRNQVGYLALDRIVGLVKRIFEAFDEEAPPLQVPPLNAPLALATSGGDGWVQFEILFPTELIVAGKNAAMAMMMSQAAPPPSEGQQTPPPSDPQ